jgi:Baseplate J-like protein
VPLLTVADLLSVSTQADALQLELTICAELGLPTTAWQPISPEMAILGANSQIVATYSVTVSQIAQGGFASSAAVIPGTGTLVDGNGFTTTWMDLVSINVYNVSRFPPTFARGGPVILTNTGAIAYTKAVGEIHLQNPSTGATYSNVDPVIISAHVSVGINVQADAAWPGALGTVIQGTTLILLTPMSGVSIVVPLPLSLVGTSIETNAALLLRCIAKLGSLSPDGSPQAYNFVATSIPTPATQSQATFPFNELPYTVSAPINRVATLVNIVNGVVGVYIANAGGVPSGADVTTVSNAIQALCTPLSVTSNVSAVTEVPLNLFYNVYVQNSSGRENAIKQNINSAVNAFCSTAPIGGFSTSQPNIIPYDELVDVIMNANRGTVDLQLYNPPGNVAIASTSVPTLGTTNGGSQVLPA